MVLLSNKLIAEVIKLIWNEVMNKLNNDTKVMILFRIKWSNGNIVTLGDSLTITNLELNIIINYIEGIFNLKDDNYHTNNIMSIIISYHIVKEDVSVKFNIPKLPKDTTKIEFTKGSVYILPTSHKLSEWGTLINKVWDNNNWIYTIIRDIYKFIVSVNEATYDCKVFYNDQQILDFNETMWDNDYEHFTRIFKKGQQKVYYKNGQVKLIVTDKATRLLKTIKPSKSIKSNIITMDIETILKNGSMTPYSISIYDGETAWSYYLLEYPNAENMIKHALSSLFVRKYNNHKIYMHNLSKFDSVFLLRLLESMDNITTRLTRNNGKIINLNIRYNNKYNLSIRDSLLLLPSSLRKLAKSFNTEEQYKGTFPILFLGNIEPNYIGPVTYFKYFKDITFEEYQEYLGNYPNNIWSLKDETIKYCEMDCISLYNVLCNFNLLIFDHFQLNIVNYPTLSSLAFGIFRSKFLKEDNKIALISGKLLDDIKQGYYGGHTEVYKTYGENLYHYDVNSLYPFIMKNCPMPIGPVKHFEGDINHLNTDDRPFGFFHVEITCPDNLDKPILMTRVRKDGKNITMCPTGKWVDVLFSEEMYNAEKYGYKFKILRGYIFSNSYIFNDYVLDLYNIKSNTPKSDPMYLISNLLLNSLYGRFGLHAETLLSKTSLLTNQEMYEINNKITDVLALSDNKNYVTWIDKEDDEIQMDNLKQLNITLPIAAAVTAYARIHMSQFKNNTDYNIYYTDTDSIVIDKPLDKSLINDKELGLMKLENVYNEFVALAPKVYGGITINNQDITKVKGFKNNIPFETLKSLLVCPEDKLNKIELTHQKWIRNYEKGEIKIKDQIYSLIPTDNKRALIIKNEILIGTMPYNINEVKEVK